jgi:hypothetical protein
LKPQLARLRTHLSRRSGKRQVRAAFAAIFGVLWLALEPAGLFFPDTFDWGWSGYVGLVALSGIAAIIVARPRTEIIRSLPPTDVTVSIRVGDVLDQRGNIIVGSNDTFDTRFEDGIISPASVQGQMLTRSFGADHVELDRLISASLPDSGVEDNDKTFGNRRRYPVGTVAQVIQGDVRYFLPAFATMSKGMPANVKSTVEDLQVALARTWEAVNIGGQREPVHTPIIGSHLGRIGVSKTLLIQMIVLSFLAAARQGGPSELTVWIRPDDQVTVDLAVLDEWLRGLCAA